MQIFSTLKYFAIIIIIIRVIISVIIIHFN